MCTFNLFDNYISVVKLAFCTILVVHPLRSVFSAQISPEENDTAKVLEELTRQTAPSGILSILSRIHGPWAFIFWQVDLGHSLLLLTNCTVCVCSQSWLFCCLAFVEVDQLPVVWSGRVWTQEPPMASSIDGRARVR